MKFLNPMSSGTFLTKRAHRSTAQCTSASVLIANLFNKSPSCSLRPRCSTLHPACTSVTRQYSRHPFGPAIDVPPVSRGELDEETYTSSRPVAFVQLLIYKTASTSTPSVGPSVSPCIRGARARSLQPISADDND
jgi:hypothetical protein